MSGGQWDDHHQRKQAEWIASELGITVDELEVLDWSVHQNDGNDGAVYGHRVEFGDDSDPEVLASIDGLQNGRWVNIGFPPEPNDPDYDGE
jgi:hypothetical protein